MLMVMDISVYDYELKHYTHLEWQIIAGTCRVNSDYSACIFSIRHFG